MRFSFIALLPVFILIGCTPKGEKEEATNEFQNDSTELVVEEVPEFPKDSVHDKIAHYLSGTSLYFEDAARNITEEKWVEYSQTISGNWSMIEEKRLTPMREWESSYFRNQVNDTMQLFYPFSGPDFLHASMIYPNANDYIFLANEKIGEIPDFETMTEQEHLEYLHNVDFFLRDIYKRSYFITGNMIKDIGGEKVEGVLPIFYVFLSKTGHEIMDVEFIDINADGSTSVYPDSINVPNNEYHGVRFYFRKSKEERIKTLMYFYCDISDNGFRKNPELEIFLKNIRPSNGFVKSASYLMHYNSFSTIREIVLDKTQALFQDDTGIPFKYFDKDTHDFILFGKYERPISDFSEKLTQNDLAGAYSNGNYEVQEMPFSLGYHWHSKKQNYLLVKDSELSNSASPINKKSN